MFVVESVNTDSNFCLVDLLILKMIQRISNGHLVEGGTLLKSFRLCLMNTLNRFMFKSGLWLSGSTGLMIDLIDVFPVCSICLELYLQVA